MNAFGKNLAGFMTSADLHTQARFQNKLPESFAIVCAPKSMPKSEMATPHRESHLLTEPNFTALVSSD